MLIDATQNRIPAATDSVDGAVRAVRDFPRAMWVDLLRRDQSERWRAGCGAAGRYAQAIQCFEESKQLHAPHPLDMCFEGIAYFHLGELEQSRRCVRQARDWIDEANRESLPPTDWATPAWWNLPWHERTDARRLLAEAESLVNAW